MIYGDADHSYIKYKKTAEAEMLIKSAFDCQP